MALVFVCNNSKERIAPALVMGVVRGVHRLALAEVFDLVPTSLRIGGLYVHHDNDGYYTMEQLKALGGGTEAEPLAVTGTQASTSGAGTAAGAFGGAGGAAGGLSSTPLLEALKEQLRAEFQAGIAAHFPAKRHRTAYTEMPISKVAEVDFWRSTVQDRNVPCSTTATPDWLPSPRPLLVALRYLTLLMNGRHVPMADVIRMKLARQRLSPDLEVPYYPAMLAAFQAAAGGEPEIVFKLEYKDPTDSARPDLCCWISGAERTCGEAKARSTVARFEDCSGGIHSNADAFGKIHKVIRAKYLEPGLGGIFLCPFIVRIECLWIARLEYNAQHEMTSCSVTPTIPASNVCPPAPLCGQLDEVLLEFGKNDYAAVTMTDVLLAHGDEAPIGFQLMTQYVEALCLQHHIPLAVPVLTLRTGEQLDLSDVTILAHGGKSLILQLGTEQAVVKVGPAALIENEVRMHAHVDTLPSTCLLRRMVPDGYGTVKGAGGLAFLKLEGLASPAGTLPINWSNVEAYWQQADKAVCGLHSRRVLHRDIKPGNFVVQDNKLVLNDLDVSCHELDAAGVRCCRVGTPAYRAYTWTEGEAYEQKHDWVALGLTFAHFLNVNVGSAQQSLEVLINHPSLPSTIRQRLSAALQ